MLISKYEESSENWYMINISSDYMKQVKIEINKIEMKIQKWCVRSLRENWNFRNII